MPPCWVVCRPSWIGDDHPAAWRARVSGLRCDGHAQEAWSGLPCWCGSIPLCQEVAARIGWEPLGAQEDGGGSIRTAVQGLDSGATVAAGSAEMWCWDVTFLPPQGQGRWSHLYLVLDLYSRKISASRCITPIVRTTRGTWSDAQPWLRASMPCRHARSCMATTARPGNRALPSRFALTFPSPVAPISGRTSSLSGSHQRGQRILRQRVSSDCQCHCRGSAL